MTAALAVAIARHVSPADLLTLATTHPATRAGHLSRRHVDSGTGADGVATRCTRRGVEVTYLDDGRVIGEVRWQQVVDAIQAAWTDDDVETLRAIEAERGRTEGDDETPAMAFPTDGTMPPLLAGQVRAIKALILHRLPAGPRQLDLLDLIEAT